MIPRGLAISLGWWFAWSIVLGFLLPVWAAVLVSILFLPLYVQVYQLRWGP